MEGKVYSQTYEKPHAMRLDSTPRGAGGSTCFAPGSNADYHCSTGFNATNECQSDGNSALQCVAEGSSVTE